MSYEKLTEQELIDLAIYEMVKDFQKKDVTAIEELLKSVPKDHLVSFLPEGLSKKDIKERIKLVNNDLSSILYW